jgi:Tol biopolymer transport system component
LLKSGDAAAAQRYFQTLVVKYPRRPEPHYELGKLFYKLQDLAQTRDYFLDTLERNPSPDLIRGILEITNWWRIGRPDAFHGSPAFSPDGKKLLFCAAREDTNGDGKIDASDRAGIYLFDLGTGSVREIVSNEFHNSSPVWSPDGRAMLYLSNRWTGQAPESPGAQTLLLRNLESQAESVVVHPAMHPRYPVFTPDGMRLVVCTIDHAGGPSGLSIIDRGSQARTPLTSHAWEHTFPQISRDGRSLLYVSWRKYVPEPGKRILDANPGIYLMDLLNGREQELLDDRACNAYPVFSPDGKSILYLSRRRDTNNDGRIDHLDHFGIYSLRLSDRKETCIVPDTHYNKFASWSADGKSVLFIARWPRKQPKAHWETPDYFEHKGLYRVSASGGDVQVIVSDKFYGSRFCDVAPSGDWVAYVSWQGQSNRGLYIARYNQLPTLAQLRGFIETNLR